MRRGCIRSAAPVCLQKRPGIRWRLVELADTSRPTDRQEHLSPGPEILTKRLEHAFAARLEGLPKETRLALLAGALDGRASLAEIIDSAAELHGGPVELADLDAASAARLVEIARGKLMFHHPLVRSAVRQAAPPAQVLAMYAALAGVVGDPERRLWCRAMAAVDADEEIATALEAQASTARGRGAISAAAAALERSAALSTDPRRKGKRPLRAAELPTSWDSPRSRAGWSPRPRTSVSVRPRRRASPGCDR